MKAIENIHLRTAGVVQACQHFYYSGLINTNSKFYKECMFSLVILPPGNFAIFDNQGVSAIFLLFNLSRQFLLNLCSLLLIVKR